MAENKTKPTKQQKPTGETSPGIFGYIESGLNFDNFFEEGKPFRFLPQLLFILFLGILFIANSHYTDRMNKRHSRLKREVEDLRVDYTTLKAEYMLETKQSEVAARVKKQGLILGTKPPVKIEIEKKK
jgi:hypothetical protein